VTTRHHQISTCAAVGILFAGLVASTFQAALYPPRLHAQAKPLPQQKSGVSPSTKTGGQIFDSTCAGCHGLDGRGGERAPDIAGRPKVQQLSDADLSHIVQEGIPGTGMPGFQTLKPSEVLDVVAYLRTLQGAKKTFQLPGDPARGKTLFGKAGCSSCHMVAGNGGFIASDLSEYGRVHSADEIHAAITSINQGRDRQARIAVATTQGGEKYTGRIRNEDNFSLQLQTLDGAFHLLSKSDLANLEVSAQPLMPSDYGTKLSPTEVNDIVSYLMHAAKAREIETETAGTDE